MKGDGCAALHHQNQKSKRKAEAISADRIGNIIPIFEERRTRSRDHGAGRSISSARHPRSSGLCAGTFAKLSTDPHIIATSPPLSNKYPHDAYLDRSRRQWRPNRLRLRTTWTTQTQEPQTNSAPHANNCQHPTRPPVLPQCGANGNLERCCHRFVEVLPGGPAVGVLGVSNITERR